MLHVRDVTFGYRLRAGGRQTVLDAVSLDAPSGRIVGLLGPNGSGKTTLLRVIARMLRPEAGVIELDGRPVASLSRIELARRMAVVPQETHATFDISVIDMVLMGRYPHLSSFALESPRDIAIARDAMAATGTLPFATRSFATLSGGEKQRVVIASALAQASELLLLDEPTAALDLGYQFEIAALLRRLNVERGTTMIVSTHDLNFAAALCDHVVLIKRGRVIADGPTEGTLTADNIRTLYDVEVDVQMHARAGHVTVVPIGRAH
jgi:iron complex transport system ATP-binding protein